MGSAPSVSARLAFAGSNTDDLTKKQELYDLHQYLEDPEDVGPIDPKNPPLILPEVGFRTELGGRLTPEEAEKIPVVLEEVEKHSLFYKEVFCDAKGEPHTNYIGGNAASPVIISLLKLDKVKKSYNWKALVRTKKEDLVYDILAPNRKTALKELARVCSDMTDVPLFEVHDPNIIEDLKHMEDRLLIKAYKFGVVYCKAGQTDENDMFSNEHGSPEFNEFMDLIGTKTKLKDYKGYRGGLDTKENTTGPYTYTTTFGGFEIMYHVSTLLPYSKQNPQQVERKRHIGNDVVVIVFRDGPTPPFKPTTITSKFNHVYVVVQLVKSKRKKSGSISSSAATSTANSNQSDAPPKRSSRVVEKISAGAQATAPEASLRKRSSRKNINNTNGSGSSNNNNTNGNGSNNNNTSNGNKSNTHSSSKSKNPPSPRKSNNSKSSKSHSSSNREKLTKKSSDDDLPRYRVAIVSKHGVKPHGPVLPSNKVFVKGEEFRNWLLTKLVNAERAAYYAPGFAQTRTRRLWLKDILEKYSPNATPFKY